jgi:hypothetical protein
LTEREVQKLIAAAKGNRHGQRDSTMILICFRHGLRAGELCSSSASRTTQRSMGVQSVQPFWPAIAAMPHSLWH